MKFSLHIAMGILVLPGCGCMAAAAQTQATPQLQAAAPQNTTAGYAKTKVPKVSEDHRLQAESAYVAGARALSDGKAELAEKHFTRAAQLDSTRPEYALAAEIARQHRVTALVQAAAQANRKGKKDEAARLLDEAAKIDPTNEIVKQHEDTGKLPAGLKDYAATIDAAKANAENLQVAGGLLARVSATPQDEGYKGPVHLKFNNEKHSFHESGSSRQLIPKVLLAYGIKAQMDASANSQTMRLDVDDMTAAEMIPLLDKMTQTFVVPLDEHSVMVGRDTQEVRDRLEPLLYETVYLPGMSDDDLKTMLAVTHDFFGIKQSAMQTSSQTLTVRATEETLTALNRTLADLMDDDSEVLMEVSLYELDTSRSQQTGVQAPQQLTAFNFDSEIQQVVQANQSTINQAISSGLIQQGNYLQYAELLLGAGLLNSTVFGQNFVLFGNGLTRTGLSGVGGTLNMALNTSEARMVDETHILAKNKVAGTFRAGERYPITTSTFSNVASAGTSAASLSGLSASQLALLGLSGAAGLASGTTQVIPQIQYEDLGLTLVTTPVIQRDGVVTLHFNLKLESLGGTSSNGIPILNNRAFSGDVTVQDGQSAVIVSTLTKQEVGAISGTPGVDEIPGFSDVFSSKSTNGIGQQLVLVVKPHLVRRAQNVYAGPMMMLSGHPVASASP